MRVSGLAPKLISWIACLAILVGSIAPTLVHASRKSTGSDWVEVCTSLGAQWVETANAGQGDTGRKAPFGHAGMHCPICSSHPTTLGMPPAMASVLVIPSILLGLPGLFVSAQRTTSAWAAAQPRAPPHLS